MKKIIAPSAIFIAILAAYPLEWALLAGKSPRYWGDLKLAAVDNLAILFLAIMTFFPALVAHQKKDLPFSARAPFLLAGVTIIIAQIQQLIYPGNLDFFLAGAFPATAFLAGAAISNQWKKTFPLLAGIFAIVLLVYSALTNNFVGFPGNWNWNFTLVAVTIPALASWFFKGRKLVVTSIIAIAVFITAGVLKRPDILPRGTLLALAGAAAVMLLLPRIPEKLRVKVIAGVFVACIIGFILFITVFAREVPDYRIQLWRGSCQLFLEHPFAGCGQSRFEGLVPDFLPEEYHFVKFRAERHTHPHNEVLFMLTSFGIFGGLFLLTAMTNSLRNNSEKDFNTKYLQWVVIVLFLHGMVDVLLGEVHSGTLFWVSLGALNALPFADAPDDAPNAASKKVSTANKIVSGIGGALLLGCFMLLIVRNFVGTGLCREAKLDFRNGNKTIELLSRAEKIKPTPECSYLLGIEFFSKSKLPQAVKKFAEIESKFGWGGYVHSNGLAARAYAAQKEYTLASHYFEREQHRFPFSIVNVYYQLKMLKTIAPEAAEQHMAQLDHLLKQRGVNRNSLPEIMRYQYLDDLLPIKKE